MQQQPQRRAESSEAAASLLKWSDKQSHILTGGGVSSRLSFSEDELPHFHKARGSTHAAFALWHRQGTGLGAEIAGAWKRPLFVGGWTHSDDSPAVPLSPSSSSSLAPLEGETTFNLQTPSVFIDIRVPNAGAALLGHHRGFDTMTDLHLRLFARRHAFAGYTRLEPLPLPGETLETGRGGSGGGGGGGRKGREIEQRRRDRTGCGGSVATRHHCIDWNYVGEPRPRPNKWRVQMGPGGDVWKEWGLAKDAFDQHVYMERWERLPGGRGPFFAIRRRPSSAPDALLVVCGDHFALIVDRPPGLMAGGEGGARGAGGLVGLVDDAVAKGDRRRAIAFLSLEASHGRVSGQRGCLPWTVDCSLHPWLEKQRPFSGAVLTVAGDGLSVHWASSSTSYDAGRWNGVTLDGVWDVVENTVSPLTSAIQGAAASPPESDLPPLAFEAVLDGSVGGGGQGETSEGAPAAGDQVGDSCVQECSNDTGEAVASSSSSSSSEGLPLKHPATVYSSPAGIELDIPAATVTAVDTFQVPSGFVRMGYRNDSFMYSLGVYAEQIGGNQHKFFCLASHECRRKKKTVPCTRGDRSNVNSHLKKVHSMQGRGGLKKQSTRKEKAKSLAASKDSQLRKNRVRELLCTKWVVEGFLAFNFFSGSDMWRQTIGFETAESTPYPPLPAARIKHLLVEMFVATKKVVMGNMHEEMKKAPLPILHYGVDLWTCKTSSRKFIDFHVFYVDSNFELQHTILAVKHYAPSADAQANSQASQTLFTIFRSVLAESGIQLSDLAGGTTDSGSDVRAMCVNFLLRSHKVPWDWCGCHLVDRAAEHAFATSAGPQKSKNTEARRVVQLVIKAAAKVNHSHIFKQKFDEAQMDKLGEVLKISKHAPQRWLNLVRVMERIIRLWHVLRKVYADDGVDFPLDNNKDDILQLYSLLQPLSDITGDGQNGAVPMSAEIHLAFAVIKQEVLNPKEQLRVVDIPASPGSPEAEQANEEHQRKKGKPPLPHKMVEPKDLRPVTITTREELNKVLVQNLFSRMWDEETPEPSPFRDNAVLLTPSYKDSDFRKALALTVADSAHLASGKAHLAPTADAEVEGKLDDCWVDIKKRALEAARKQHSATGNGDQPPLKRFCTASTTPAKPRFAFLARTKVRGDTEDGSDDNALDQVLIQQVTGELERYQALFVKAEELDTRDVLGWWRRSRQMFPFLAPVAQQVFGNQAGAAQVERDFSKCADLLTRHRSRVDTYWEEMIMFLHANFKHIPDFKHIPNIADEDIRKALPARFTRVDADLAAAEADFDIRWRLHCPGRKEKRHGAENKYYGKEKNSVCWCATTVKAAGNVRRRHPAQVERARTKEARQSSSNDQRLSHTLIA
eukprot:g12500.t2